MTVNEKNYGIDALKMLSMLMIVVLHIFNVGGVLNATDRFTSQYELGWFVQISTFCAVDFIRLQFFKILHIRQGLDMLEQRIRVRISK